MCCERVSCIPTRTCAHTQNYDLKTAQSGYRKAMLQQAMHYETDQASREEVAQEMVEEAMWEKFQLARDTQVELQGLFLCFLIIAVFLLSMPLKKSNLYMIVVYTGLEERIIAVGEQLQTERMELEKWQKYKVSKVVWAKQEWKTVHTLLI